jgi:hypothetical protein
LEYGLKKGDRGENGLQPISLVLKPEHLVSEITLEGIGMWTVISGSKMHTVPPIKFNGNLIERVAMATMEDQKWQKFYNTARDTNPNTNLDYFYGALSYKGRLWIA